MLRLERESRIIRWLKRARVAQVSDLGKALGVSENTIRRDLHRLEKMGVLKRVYGGAVLNENSQGLDEVGWQERESMFGEEKEKIGRAGAEMAKDDEAIILDAGTTTMQIARFIDNRTNLIAVTNAVNIASELSQKEDITVVLTGGIFRKISVSLVGPQAEYFFNNEIYVDKAFISAGGVSAEAGVTNANSAEIPTKKAIIRAAREVILVVTHDKIGKRSFSQIVPIRGIDKIITGKDSSQKQVGLIRKEGVEVILV